MARPIKNGLDYFPLDVDIFEDDKLFDVQNEYGAVGEAVYLRLLCLVYKNGYYFRFESLDKLALLLLRSIGNKWADKEQVKEMILYLGKCGLFSAELLRAGVVTSRSIQRRFLKAKERTCPVIDEYCLIPREPVPAVPAVSNEDSLTPKQPVPDAPAEQAGVIAAETGVNVAETGVIVYNNPTKESKEKQSKEKESTAEQSREKESTAEQSREKESTAEQSKAQQSTAEQSRENERKAEESRAEESIPADPRTQLVSKYGSRAVEDYECRYRSWQQKNGIKGGNMYNLISKWMVQDGVAEDNAPQSFDMDEVMAEIMRKYSG